MTRVGAVSSPVDCPPELAVAELRLATSSGSRRYRISLEALERGILIGRYGRCLNLGNEEFSVLSRVHLLIHPAAGVVTGSTAAHIVLKRIDLPSFGFVAERREEAPTCTTSIKLRRTSTSHLERHPAAVDI